MAGGALAFPAGFVWGAATASYQIEGAVGVDGRGGSVWDAFSHQPGRVRNGDTGDVACDHYARMPGDVDLMAELGLMAYRFSIAWPRVLPEGAGRVNGKGMGFYDRLVDELLERGIEPFPTLFHWDLPLALESRGGFRARDSVRWFTDYALAVVSRLGDRVRHWATLNEPFCFAYLGHAAGVHAPGMRDPRAAVAVAHHQMLAHASAARAMRSIRADLQVGIALNPAPVRWDGLDADRGEEIVRRVDGIMNRWFLDAVLRGRYPADVIDDLGAWAEVIHDGDEAELGAPIDWLGINYYNDHILRPAREGDRAAAQYVTAAKVVTVDPPPDDCTDSGWPITPDGFTELLVRIHREHPNGPPIYITETGAAYDDPLIEGRVDDRRRISWLDRNLRAVHAAIAQGVDVRGCFVWSLLDNFEWAEGYAKRFGLVHVDFDRQRRTPKASARWYGDLIRTNVLPERPEG